MKKNRKEDFQNKPVRLHIKAFAKSEHHMNINMFKCPDCGEWFHISFGHTCKKNPSSKNISVTSDTENIGDKNEKRIS